MSEKKSPKEISGWYVKTKATEAERQQIEEWYDRKVKLNYRTIAIEAPGKMVAALGVLAREKGMDGPRFGDFIEGVLDEYLENRGINWRERAY
jgi:hypothetical protein